MKKIASPDAVCLCAYHAKVTRTTEYLTAVLVSF